MAARRPTCPHCAPVTVVNAEQVRLIEKELERLRLLDPRERLLPCFRPPRAKTPGKRL